MLDHDGRPHMGHDLPKCYQHGHPVESRMYPFYDFLHVV